MTVTPKTETSRPRIGRGASHDKKSHPGRKTSKLWFRFGDVGHRCWVDLLSRIAILVFLFALTDPFSAYAFQSQVPAGSGIVVNGVHPEPRNDPQPLVSHFPLANFLSFELDFSTPAMALTFEQGIVTYYDESGNSYNEETFGVTDFDTYSFRFGSTPPGTGADIPMGERIVLFFPLEDLEHNEVPEWLDVAFCFAEFAGPNGECDNPLLFEEIRLYEYHVPPGQTYIYPIQTPAEQNEMWWSGGAFELKKPNNHRTGGFRANGLTTWVNQRYAWDIGVIRGKNGPDCDDGNGNSGNACNMLDHYFCWGEPILAPADGNVVLLIQGNPDNPEPRCVGRQDCSMCTSYGPLDPPRCDLAPGAATCNNQPEAGLCSATSDPCPPGGFPGSGNQVVLLHDNGEFTTFAHMMQGSNDHISCGMRVLRGETIGAIGMSGSGSNPHLHFSALYTPGPEAFIAEGPPMYFNNVQFVTPGTTTPRRQLDVAIPTETLLTSILPSPSPLPSNAPQPQGNVNEQEPNNVLAQHTALTYPTNVLATLEASDVGDLAVRGDGIEDIFRVDLDEPDSLRVALNWQDSSQNLDVYALDEELRVLNDTRQGTAWQPGTSERVCLELEPGAYYLMVTNADQSPSGDTAYSMSVVSDPQTIDVTIAGGANNIEVDNSCQSVVNFSIDLHDNCCLDPENLNLQVIPSNPTNNATIGEVVLDEPQVLSPRDIVVMGHVQVSNLINCQAVLRIDASAQDCTGNVVDSMIDPGSDSIEVIDTIPPVVTSSVAKSRLLLPNHELLDVGFTVTATDNCDAQVGQTLLTEAWSDESEVADSASGNHAPDAKDLNGLVRLRAERQGNGNGRVYLLTSEATDVCGNRGFACTVVGVPHDRSQTSSEDLMAQEFAAQLFCEEHDGAAPPEFLQQGLSGDIGPKQ